MTNHFTITITDNEKGVKQYNLNNIVKKVLFYTALFLLLFILITVGTIFYLNSNIEKLEAKKEQIAQAYKTLTQKNESLQHQILKAKRELEKKQTEFEEISKSLAEIETLIGLTPQKDMTLQQRVDLTKLTADNIAAMLQFIPNGTPIAYTRISSKYGWRHHPILNKRELHPGIDLKADLGTPVYATADGIVEYAGYHSSSGYGKLIIIDNNYGFKTYFAHLKTIKIKSREYVKKGQLIGYSGNTGLSNGPHLHYEVRFIQRPLNPYYFMQWGVENFSEIFEKEKNVPWQSLVTMIANIKIVKQAQLSSHLDQTSTERSH